MIKTIVKAEIRQMYNGKYPSDPISQSDKEWISLDMIPKSASFTESPGAESPYIVEMHFNARLRSDSNTLKTMIRNGVILRMTRADGSILIAGTEFYWLFGSVQRITPSKASASSCYQITLSGSQADACQLFE